jgi:hypothetical protein
MVLLACPRVAPDWELNALRALMKPQTRNRIEHAPALQSWKPAAEAVIRSACREVKSRIGYGPALHFPDSGDYAFAAEVGSAAIEEAKGLALVISTRFPELWFVFGRLLIRGGEFYRRERGIKLNLIVASNVHLTRPIRAALRDLL